MQFFVVVNTKSRSHSVQKSIYGGNWDALSEAESLSQQQLGQFYTTFIRIEMLFELA